MLECASVSGDSLAEDPDEGALSGSRFKLSLEDVDHLLTAIHDTLGINEESVALSRHDLMYKDLEEPKGNVFPAHKVLSDSILKEWADPECKPFFPRI